MIAILLGGAYWRISFGTDDSKLVSAARELRDRYLEQVNCAALPSAGKYAVGRQLSAPADETIVVVRQPPLLGAA